MKSLALLLLALALPASAKDAIPDAVLLPDAPAYATVDDAAHAALLKAMPLSGSHEYGGAVMESEGVFYFTEPVTNGRTGEIAFAVQRPSTHRIVGIYHTHPDESEHTLKFSPNDVRQAKALAVRSYIGVMRDRSIRVYDPATMRVERFRRSGSNLTQGEVADGEVLVTDVPLR